MVLPLIKHEASKTSMFRVLLQYLQFIPTNKSCLDCGKKDIGQVNQADIVHGVFLCETCARLHQKLLPGPHRILPIPSTDDDLKRVGNTWTFEDIERLCRLGNLRVQQYYMGSSPYYFEGFWQYRHKETFWKHNENLNQHILKKYVRKLWIKRSCLAEAIPRLARRHAAEDRVLLYLGLNPDRQIPSAKRYQLILKKGDTAPAPPPMSGMTVSATVTSVSDSATVTPNIQSYIDTASSFHDIAAESDTSSDDSVVFTFTFDPIESPPEKAARLKRYRDEEIKYLGLEIIRPTITPPLLTPSTIIINRPPTQQTAQRVGDTASKTRRNETEMQRCERLLKERFEDWLDTLNPSANPAIPVSQPSTIIESEGNLSDTSSRNDSAIIMKGSDRNGTVVRWIDDSSTLRDGKMGDELLPQSQVEMQELRRCKECGKKMLEGYTTRELAVQTDLTGPLILF